MMKDKSGNAFRVAVLFILLTSIGLSQNNDAIYFENMESVEFKIDEDGIRVLSFSINNEKGYSRWVFMKAYFEGKSEYYYGIIDSDKELNPKQVLESTVRATMPTIIKYYVDKYKIKLKEINRVVNKIYK